MALDAAALERVAAMARLQLNEAEMARLSQQLGDILEHIERLLAIDVDTSAVPPLGLDPAAAPRDDVPDADPLQHELAEIAPAWRDGFFTVPRVLAP